MDPDGTLHVTPPGGRTRTTRPAGITEVDMSTPTGPDTLTDLLGPTPKRYRSPTPEQRATRRAAAAERARLAAEIEAELDAAQSRLATRHPATTTDDDDERTADAGRTTGCTVGADDTARGATLDEAEAPPF